MKKLLIALLLLSSFHGISASVDTVSIYSNVMKKAINCVVITPDAHKKKKERFPVVYLLHGYSGSYNNWITRVPGLSRQADLYGMIIVCPDGGFSSWYLDSPVDSTIRYETYVGLEVPAYIDANYRTIASRAGRAITGLSMGGHGGLFIGFRHASDFGACGSMSGGVNLYATKKRYDIAKRVGDTAENAAVWKSLSVINLVENRPSDSLAIIIDCGVNDFFYADNKALHQKLLALKIAHEYTERPGRHDWPYWANAIEYQLLFFRNYFERMKVK